MDKHAELRLGLRRSNARFVTSMNRILEQYNHPFEDDFVVSLDTLTYNTPGGTKRWGEVSTKKVKKWKKEIFEYNRASQRNTEISKKQSSDCEDGHSTVHQESSENSAADTSDTGEASGVDIVSIRRKFEGIHLQNLNVDDGKKLEKVRVQMDVIVQDNPSNIPQWKTIIRPVSSKGLHLTLSVQEPIGNQAAVCRKKLELSNECSSYRSLQSQYSGVPISSNAITIPRHRPSPELSKTLCDSMHRTYQSADEECSWSNETLADLYPAMVEILRRLMKKKSQRKVLKHMFQHLMSKRWNSRRSKLNVTVDKIGGFRPSKLKKQDVICIESEDDQDPTYGNESREFSNDNCLINDSSALVPYAYTDRSEIKMDYSDSSSEQHLVSGKGKTVSKQTGFPNVMARMGETSLAGDDLQTTASPKNSKYTECEKLAYKCPSEHCFRTSPAGPDSTALKKKVKSKTQKTDFSCIGISELCSPACSSYGNSNISTPVTNYSSTRWSNTLLINPEKIISEGQISLPHERLLSSQFMKQSPSKKAQKYEDAFEKLYYEVRSKEIQKPLTLTRPPLNSQNLEEKGRLVKSSLSGFVRSRRDYDREFDRIYEQLCGEAAPKSPGFQTASNLRKYEGIQMSETVNALVNSPGRNIFAIPRVKRVGNFQNDLLCSPVKRLKHIPECYFSSRKCQDISHSKKVNLWTAGMDFLSTYNCSNPSFLEDHNCQSQDFEIHNSSDKTFHGIPGTSLQEPGAGAHYGWPKAMENCSSPRKVRKHHQRVCRKLSYTDGKEQFLG